MSLIRISFCAALFDRWICAEASDLELHLHSCLECYVTAASHFTTLFYSWICAEVSDLELHLLSCLECYDMSVSHVSTEPWGYSQTYFPPDERLEMKVDDTPVNFKVTIFFLNIITWLNDCENE
ncbi:hypothetical protein AVEN_184443-1 [Araneus ventricosus]|uniref:Uncharacterized protein n=1 Tax=Araneus ventricosus TaxID=182803 RepID=A0A4Y2BII2_ARAVE|nr:hypothetical protein AVEN_184443-1 [Araneus ventricosus]